MCLILLITCISSISAEDNSSIDNNSINAYSSDDNTVSANKNIETDVLKDSNPKTFTDLENLINSNTNGTIDLDSDYSFSDGDDAKGIQMINKSITINGNKHIIDGKNNSIIFNISSSEIRFNNINFINGLTTNESRDTGLIEFSKSNISCVNTSFSNSNAKVFSSSNSNLTIKDSEFNNIYPTSEYEYSINGLLGTTSNSNINIDNSKFSNIYGGGYSGSFLSFEDHNFNISNSNFTNCSSSGKGGVFYFALSNANISNCRFINGASGSSGGVIYSNKANINIGDSEFINNTIDTSKKYVIGKGGALSFRKSNVNIINSKFDNNSANIGGSIYYERNNNEVLNIINSSFTNDKAIYGAAIDSTSNYLTNIINSSFTNENSRFGGAISYYKGNLSIENSEFNNCNATEFGGAIVTNSNVTIVNTKFNNNTGSYGNDIAIFNKASLNTINSTVNIYCFEDLLHPLSAGYKNVTMNDSSKSYCSEFVVNSPSAGEDYYVYNTALIYNKLNDQAVNDYVKILIYEFYLRSNYTDNEIQNGIWVFTDRAFWDLDNLDLSDNVRKIASKTIELYNTGFRVEDYGATYLLENGSIITYKFNALFNPGTQNLLNIRIFYNENPLPNMSIEKVSLNKTVTLGNQTSFNIIVTNTGNIMLNDIVVYEDEYKGLTYDNWESISGVWNFNGDNTKPSWTLKNLAVNQTAVLKVIFNTTEVGNFTNIIIVGSNETNNQTTNNTTNVTPSGNNTPGNNTHNHTNKITANENNTSNNSIKFKKEVNSTSTGNPLSMLLLALSSIGLVTIKRKK